MDFLKTLMLYMTMTLAASVQGAPMPEATPTPTPTPAAVVSTILPEQATATPSAPGITEIPVAQATATPVPKPTITPNTAYRNLENGDRGDKVKQLQERLIELGYLTGEADGAFGNQTRRAVLRFQYYNGLQQDGIAGRATQTILFESPDVIANPEAATATPTPTGTPAPTDIPSPTDVPPEATPEATEDLATLAPLEELPDASAAPEAAEAEPVELHEVADASVVLNDGGAPLTFLKQEDGVTVNARPRLYESAEGDVYISLAELCASIPEWTLTQGDGWLLEAEGYRVQLSSTEDGTAFMAEADAAPLELAQGDLRLEDSDLLARASFLEKALHAITVYDDEEQTFMIRVLPKEVADAQG